MDKAVLYLRLSKEDVDKISKGDDSESIINQRLLLTDFAVSHDMQIVDVYSDDDYSGLYDDRPEFDRLIHDGKLGKYNVVIAKTQSRFTRNMEHMEKYLHHDFPLLGIRFIGVVDGVDTLNSANKKSRQINGLVNEWYCEDLSNNIKAVFKQKMKAGQFLGSFAPYGYLKDPNDKHKFIIDEYAAGIVQKIYRLYLEGYSTEAIAHILEDEHIDSPTLYKEKKGFSYRNTKSVEYSVTYGLWSTTTIKRILSNETYIGKLQQGTCEKVSYKDKKVVAVPKEKWIVVENHHEPIIDKDTFYKVAKLRERRRMCSIDQSKVKDKKDRKAHIFSGKLRCSTCGHTMIKSGRVHGRDDDWYLRCQLANKSRKRECTSHNIRYSYVEDVVLHKIQELVKLTVNSDGNMEQLAAMLLKSDAKKQIQEYRKKENDMEARMREIARAAKMLYTDRVNGRINDDMFFELKSDFERELDQIKERKAEVEQKLLLLEQKENSKENLLDVVRRYTNYTKLTHEIVYDFIDYIEIGEKHKEYDEQEIIIHWNF